MPALPDRDAGPERVVEGDTGALEKAGIRHERDVVGEAHEPRRGQQVVAGQAQAEGLDHWNQLEGHQQDQHREEEDVGPELVSDDRPHEQARPRAR